jgi:hypothetical protein
MAMADEQAIAEIPASCTCTWALSRAGLQHWQRIGPKEDCPWHTRAEFRPRRRDRLDYQPAEWLDDDVAWRKSTLGERPP